MYIDELVKAISEILKTHKNFKSPLDLFGLFQLPLSGFRSPVVPFFGASWSLRDLGLDHIVHPHCNFITRDDFSRSHFASNFCARTRPRACTLF
jgi:hypothetical protein